MKIYGRKGKKWKERREAKNEGRKEKPSKEIDKGKKFKKQTSV